MVRLEPKCRREPPGRVPSVRPGAATPRRGRWRGG